MAYASNRDNPLKFIGLVPAAGYAKRLGPFAGSKELVRLGPKPGRAVCEFLLAQMRTAGIRHALFVIRDAKQDIPRYLGDGLAFGISLSYVVTAATPGVPHTVARARTELRDAVTVLGFPDIMVDDAGSLARLVESYRARPVDVLLGLFPLGDPLTMDAVALNDRRVLGVWPKLGRASHAHTWGFAIWRATFADFMQEWLEHRVVSNPTAEIYMGDVIHAAIGAGLIVEGVTVSDTPFVDIGTPKGLAQARERFGSGGR